MKRGCHPSTPDEKGAGVFGRHVEKWLMRTTGPVSSWEAAAGNAERGVPSPTKWHLAVLSLQGLGSSPCFRGLSPSSRGRAWPRGPRRSVESFSRRKELVDPGAGAPGRWVSELPRTFLGGRRLGIEARFRGGKRQVMSRVPRGPRTQASASSRFDRCLGLCLRVFGPFRRRGSWGTREGAGPASATASQQPAQRARVSSLPRPPSRLPGRARQHAVDGRRSPGRDSGAAFHSGRSGPAERSLDQEGACHIGEKYLV